MNERADELNVRLAEQTRGPLASRGRRRLLALGYLAAVGVTAVGALFPRPGGALVELAGFVAGAALLVLARRATRLAADAPSAALDEVLVRLRDRCFVLAYQGLATAVVLTCAVLFLFGGGGIDGTVATALAWLLFGLALGLPVMVTALVLPQAQPLPAER